MRVLLDEQLDQRLRTLLHPEFRIETVRYRGWDGASCCTTRPPSTTRW
jgi:predicted nuclease of predicted toxin-antitoxin system